MQTPISENLVGTQDETDLSQSAVTDRLYLPLLVIKYEENQGVRVDITDDRMNAVIESEDPLVPMNENHVLAAMGLTDTNEEEISQIFSHELV